MPKPVLGVVMQNLRRTSVSIIRMVNRVPGCGLLRMDWL